MTPVSSVRQLAWKCLLRWSQGGIFAETLVARTAAEHSLSHADRSLLQAIVYDTLRHMSWLDHIRKTLRPGKLEEKMRWLVLMGLCQLFVLRQAEHAAVSETVRLAPQRVRGVVNGMLRNAVRRMKELEAARAELPLEVQYSTPSWLVNRWLREFGEIETRAMLEWNTQTPPVYARLNPLNPPADIPDAWEPLPGLSGWYRLNGPLPLEALRAGQLYVTDPSTRYCVKLLAPQPGERVLDACAAPGGKSAAMLAATGGDLHLLATDVEEFRLKPLRENLLRSGGQDVQVAQHDWTQPCPAAWAGVFDAVLLDVPCSNSGVLQRRVDARWRLSENEFSRLAALQLQILEQACAAVRPGGRLVYSTCSIDREEDRAVVDAFLSTHKNFVFVREYLALPHREQADGAYAALLQRAE
ncbi:MAG: methyltransferase domain-containing protein [Akkermansia sp.]|nr:methyltransferase domain-containing protein [Akkermansia sp.]MBR2314655.1 methyltransferase domain-containing protein [Akkermansia sp.]